MYSQNIYVIRKGDMVIRPAFDDDDQRNGSEIIRFDKTRIQNPFKVQKIIER
ncbi:TPA: competence protein ComK, partial [Staphylococcus aureus]|nr:competence protein ComK [Staphylococcus aureus]